MAVVSLMAQSRKCEVSKAKARPDAQTMINTRFVLSIGAGADELRCSSILFTGESHYGLLV
jgi:hypothetical protein